MKTFARLTIPTLIAGVLVASPQLLASDFDKEEMSLGLRLGVYNLDSDRVFNTDASDPTVIHYLSSGFKNISPGIQLNAPLTEHWALRTYLDYVRGDLKGTSGSKSGYNLGVDALYRFNNNVYAGAGVGSLKVGDYTTRGLRGVVGYRQAITDRLSWSGEYALQTGSYTDHAIMFGLNLSFGSKGSAQAQIRNATSAAAGAAVATKEENKKVEQPKKPEQPKEEAVVYSAPIERALAQVDRTLDTDGDGVPDYRDVCANTPRGQEVDKYGCSVFSNESSVQHLRVSFAFDSARVPESYYDEVRDVAILLGVHEDITVEIQGHTDLIGTTEYNQGLSERRAKAVADILVNEYGIDRNRIKAVGYGKSQPVINQITLDANARNRRIETLLNLKK